MKKYIIPVTIMFLTCFACEDDFLNLDPLDSVTEAAYFNTPQQFENASNRLYGQLVGWSPSRASGLAESYNSNIFDFMSFGSDLRGLPLAEGRGANLIQNDDKYWTNTYYYLRDVNILLEKSEEYGGDSVDISKDVATAYFFRAWHHFFLLQRFGGVPIVTSVIDIDSPELYGPRNSRYEVFGQIIEDLNKAIEGLPIEQNISAADKGKISKWAAEAFKAKVLLYEATWEKYVGTTTDFAGSGAPIGSVSTYLTDAISLSKNVIENGGYQLWDYNNQLNNLSSYFLFNLEDAESNTAGLDKTTNKEFIIQGIYDFDLRKGGTNISHTVAERLSPDRKMMDMVLCTDGLPIDKSQLFQGYNKTSDEFKNRDYRLTAYFGENIPVDGSVVLPGTAGGSTSGSGIMARKFRSYKYGTYRAANEESFNYPFLRLAEVYLIYAEALVERDGSISDADLNLSINKVRARAGVAPLTNALVSTKDLDMLEEIRRERAVELYAENNRYNDLKRWGIAEQELNQDILGAVIEGTEYENNTSLYDPTDYVWGEKTIETAVGMRRVVVIDPASNRNFTRKNYLFPIPPTQINLNPALKQNPEW
ncbi:RagB/SusD family nutrient uptake outer membrane protein [Mariniflexile litorale]|uniref:RagB/SusD family nutrient uptake outer membrane protein n=1 Tax=Mariniflexile litorale TaxID=3045158 RepID=A0AAU7EDH7_9FLAO|nr:RagB/SusD family nutrient uptake outer membrane protein [Mariniflexile sp. KMM 9835]MDQ8213468.1 RagB/SusD family nutrient uptake outer membrane protein [Mariniflexile sp. KMM 9835]